MLFNINEEKAGKEVAKNLDKWLRGEITQDQLKNQYKGFGSGKEIKRFMAKQEQKRKGWL